MERWGRDSGGEDPAFSWTAQWKRLSDLQQWPVACVKCQAEVRTKPEAETESVTRSVGFLSPSPKGELCLREEWRGLNLPEDSKKN